MRSLECLIRLKQHLKTVYEITEEKCTSYASDDKTGAEKARPLESASQFSAMCRGVKELSEDLLQGDVDVSRLENMIRIATSDFNRLQLSLETSSGEVIVATKKKRKAKTPALPKVKAVVPRKRAKSKARPVVDSDEEDNGGSSSDSECSDF
jgi:hypothetical protein